MPDKPGTGTSFTSQSALPRGSISAYAHPAICPQTVRPSILALFQYVMTYGCFRSPVDTSSRTLIDASALWRNAGGQTDKSNTRNSEQVVGWVLRLRTTSISLWFGCTAARGGKPGLDVVAMVWTGSTSARSIPQTPCVKRRTPLVGLSIERRSTVLRLYAGIAAEPTPATVSTEKNAQQSTTPTPCPYISSLFLIGSAFRLLHRQRKRDNY